MYSLFRALEWAISLTQSSTPTGQPAPTTGSVNHVLYCSKAHRPFNEDELADLLEQTRATNDRCGVTGLLCYSNDHFVQVLEGPGPEIERLYALIERDPRHHQLQVLSQGADLIHRFPDWRVALAKAQQDGYWLMPCFEARVHHLLKPQIPILEPLLCSLLYAFGNLCPPPQQPDGMLGAAPWTVRPILATV